jgi:sortase (surface protein transpeptidase)
VLPGQAGESTILGRRTSFGAPFFSIGSLKPGDLIKVVTVEGPSTYKVIDSKTAQNLTGADTLNIVKEKQRLRDITKQVDALASLDELKALGL